MVERMVPHAKVMAQSLPELGEYRSRKDECRAPEKGPFKGFCRGFVIRAERKGLNVLNRVWGSIKNIKV